MQFSATKDPLQATLVSHCLGDNFTVEFIKNCSKDCHNPIYVHNGGGFK